MIGVDAARALRVDAKDPAIPSLADFARDWAIVIVDRCPGAMGPTSVGFIGRHVVAASDNGSVGGLIVGDPFDYQSGWVTDQGKRMVTRAVEIMPCEGFALESIRIDRHLAIVGCGELTAKAAEMVHKRLSDAIAMRSHFRKVGSLVATPG